MHRALIGHILHHQNSCPSRDTACSFTYMQSGSGCCEVGSLRIRICRQAQSAAYLTAAKTVGLSIFNDMTRRGQAQTTSGHVVTMSSLDGAYHTPPTLLLKPDPLIMSRVPPAKLPRLGVTSVIVTGEAETTCTPMESRSMSKTPASSTPRREGIAALREASTLCVESVVAARPCLCSRRPLHLILVLMSPNPREESNESHGMHP